MAGSIPCAVLVVIRSHSEVDQLPSKPEVIKIDRYESRIVKGQIKIYAVAGKKEYPMPDCYMGMYDEDHLAIQSRHMDRPELYDAPEDHYIPLRTAI